MLRGNVRAMCRWGVVVLSLGMLGAASKPKAVPPRSLPVVLSTTRPAVQRLPIPEVAAQVKAGVLVHEIFQREYAMQGIGPRRAFARKLTSQGLETEGDPAARFVLFREARDIAAAAGDIRTTCRAIELLDRYFQVDELRMLRSALSSAAAGSQSPQGWRAIAAAALAGARRAVAADDYDIAFRLLSIASDSAAKTRDAEWIREAKEHLAETRSLSQQVAQVKTARETLKNNPDDLVSNLLAGRYLCCASGDFAGGAPLLAKGGDAALSMAARLELSANEAGQAEAIEQYMLAANAWWELAGEYPPIARRSVQRHAGEIYRQLLTRLVGLNRSMAEKRVEMMDSESIREKCLEPGIYADLFKGEDFGQWVRGRVDARIDFDWGNDAPDESLPKDNFSFRWCGFLRVPAGGRYELIVLANQGARIWIDDRQVVDAPMLSRSRNGLRTPIDFSAGLHEIRVEYWDTTGLARMRLLWKPPGGAEAPIPESSFYHEAALPVEGGGG